MTGADTLIPHDTVARAACRCLVDLGRRPIPLPLRAKVPSLSGWQKLRLELEDVPVYFPNGSQNIGIIWDGWADVDLDGPEARAVADDFLPATALEFGRASARRSHRIYQPADGAFEYTKLSDPILEAGTEDERKRACLVELRTGPGHQTMAPPSTHPCGESVGWDKYGDPASVGAGELATALGRLAAAALLARYWPEGSRQDCALALAGGLLRARWAEADVGKFIGAVAAAADDEETASRVRATDYTARRLAAGETATGWQRLSELMPATVVARVRLWLGVESGAAEPAVKDYGHAAVLSAHFLGRYRWATHLGTWMEWTGQVWRPVPEERVAKAASDVLRVEYAGQLAAADRKDIARLAALLRDACTYSRILGALSFLKGWEDILTMPEEWDAAPWTLNVANGLLDLHTGELCPHSPEDLCTKLAPVPFDPAAKGEHWQRHLGRFLPNPNVQRQVRRDLGRALVGATLEEALDFWYGTGANGKTTTTRALQMALGDYARRAAPNLLVQSRNERHPTEVADLCGARLVFSVEVDEGKQLAEALVKDLTGGDRKKARLMRQDFFEFEQTFSITLIVNHKPIIAGTDEGIWRRVRLIPWAERIPEEERRPQDEVVAELVADGSGILNWLLAGLRDWQADHHWTAPEVIAATEAYRAEQDVLGGFLGECCELGPRFTAPVGGLYEAYCAWCAGAGEEPVGKGKAGDLLKQRGIGQRRGAHGGPRLWVGVRLGRVTSGDNVSVSSLRADVFGDEPESLSPLVTASQEQPLTEHELTYVVLAEAEGPPF